MTWWTLWTFLAVVCPHAQAMRIDDSGDEVGANQFADEITSDQVNVTANGVDACATYIQQYESERCGVWFMIWGQKKACYCVQKSAGNCDLQTFKGTSVYKFEEPTKAEVAGYVEGTSGSTSCPAGSRALTESECGLAAGYYSKAWKGLISSEGSTRPSGCYLTSNGLRFNPYPSESKSKSSRIRICQAVLRDGTYTFRQKVNNRYLDAHQTSNDYSAVTREASNLDNQKWLIVEECGSGANS